MATKIQAGYKGMMAREEFSDLINTRLSININSTLHCNVILPDLYNCLRLLKTDNEDE